jgi:ribosomal protein S9
MSDTYTATGRRKTAVARVWLTEGTGEITINEEPFEEVLTTLTLQGRLLEPLQVTNLRNKFNVKTVSRGGGEAQTAAAAASASSGADGGGGDTPAILRLPAAMRWHEDQGRP